MLSALISYCKFLSRKCFEKYKSDNFTEFAERAGRKAKFFVLVTAHAVTRGIRT